jgi:hypothetical protein
MAHVDITDEFLTIPDDINLSGWTEESSFQFDNCRKHMNRLKSSPLKAEIERREPGKTTAPLRNWCIELLTARSLTNKRDGSLAD